MRIGGIIKKNISDSPEVNAIIINVKGCNFRCSFCRSLVLTQTDMLNRTADLSEQVVFDFLRLNKDNATEVIVTGGEPTLQNALVPFLMQIKAMDFKIRLKTNGTNAAMLDRIIRMRLADHIIMDVKAALSSEAYERITGVVDDDLIDNVFKSILLIKGSGVDHEFYTVVLPGIHSTEDIEELKSILDGSKYTLQKVRIEATETAIF